MTCICYIAVSDVQRGGLQGGDRYFSSGDVHALVTYEHYNISRIIIVRASKDPRLIILLFIIKQFVYFIFGTENCYTD